MNERIKELWNYAADTTKDDSWESQTDFIKHFAKLVLEEAIEALYDTEQIGHAQFADRVIKQHFGIE